MPHKSAADTISRVDALLAKPGSADFESISTAQRDDPELVDHPERPKYFVLRAVPLLHFTGTII